MVEYQLGNGLVIVSLSLVQLLCAICFGSTVGNRCDCRGTISASCCRRVVGIGVSFPVESGNCFR